MNLLRLFRAAAGMITMVIAFSCDAQCRAKLDTVSGQEVVVYADTMPAFVGGEQAMFEYLSKNMRYPTCLEKTPMEAIWVQFVIAWNGEVQHARVNGAVDEQLQKMIIDMLEGMPGWKPASCQGEPVAFLYTLPIRINLR